MATTPEEAQRAQEARHARFELHDHTKRQAREALDWLAENDPAFALMICGEIEYRITKKGE